MLRKGRCGFSVPGDNRKPLPPLNRFRCFYRLPSWSRQTEGHTHGSVGWRRGFRPCVTCGGVTRDEVEVVTQVWVRRCCQGEDRAPGVGKKKLDVHDRRRTPDSDSKGTDGTRTGRPSTCPSVASLVRLSHPNPSLSVPKSKSHRRVIDTQEPRQRLGETRNRTFTSLILMSEVSR